MGWVGWVGWVRRYLALGSESVETCGVGGVAGMGLVSYSDLDNS